MAFDAAWKVHVSDWPWSLAVGRTPGSSGCSPHLQKKGLPEISCISVYFRLNSFNANDFKIGESLNIGNCKIILFIPSEAGQSLIAKK